MHLCLLLKDIKMNLLIDLTEWKDNNNNERRDEGRGSCSLTLTEEEKHWRGEKTWEGKDVVCHIRDGSIDVVGKKRSNKLTYFVKDKCKSKAPLKK